MIDIEKDVDVYIKDGIVFLIANKELDINLDAAIAIVNKRLDVCNGKSYPTLLDYGNSKYASRKAREYFTTEGVKGVLVAAFCTNSIPARLFINSYLMIHKPAIPTRLFSGREKATKWLKQFA
jgi:hypothetical protein